MQDVEEGEADNEVSPSKSTLSPEATACPTAAANHFPLNSTSTALPGASGTSVRD